MTKKWILYNKEDRQVSWPACVNNLSPVKNKNPLEAESLAEIRKAFNEEQNFDEIILPIRSISILGKCSTAKYLKCPNIPEHHRENARDYSRHYRRNPVSYFDRIGKYYWVDFDLVTSDEVLMKLRMVFNGGDADCNDGFWGEVWKRNTGELVANILSTGDMETTVQAVSKKYIELERFVNLVIDIVFLSKW